MIQNNQEYVKNLAVVTYAAGNKANQLMQTDCDCREQLHELLLLVTDMTYKMSKLEWVDKNSLEYAAKIYLHVIDNI